MVARLADEADLADCAERWDPANFSPIERAKIYVDFLVSKNRARIPPPNVVEEDRGMKSICKISKSRHGTELGTPTRGLLLPMGTMVADR